MRILSYDEYIEEGNTIPADARVIQSTVLQTAEAADLPPLAAEEDLEVERLRFATFIRSFPYVLFSRYFMYRRIKIPPDLLILPVFINYFVKSLYGRGKGARLINKAFADGTLTIQYAADIQNQLVGFHT